MCGIPHDAAPSNKAGGRCVCGFIYLVRIQSSLKLSDGQMRLLLLLLLLRVLLRVLLLLAAQRSEKRSVYSETAMASTNQDLVVSEAQKTVFAVFR